MKTRFHQRGMSSLGWLITILVGGFVLTCALKLGPVYGDNFLIRDALKSIATLRNSQSDPELTESDIRGHLNNYFTINGIRDVPRSAISIQRKADSMLVDINYERRIPLLYNIDVVLTFSNQFDSRRPGECCKPRSD